MPVKIGMSVHGFSDPTGFLSDCHRRMEMFLDSLEAVAKVVDRPVTEETERALRTALRYFRESAPKHTADEEESLFPRLRQIQHPDARSALEALGQLEEEHQSAVPLHAEVERLGQLYLSKGSLSPEEARDFAKAVGSLKSMYRQHIDIEDHLVFPVAARILSLKDQASIGGEMAARREIGRPQRFLRPAAETGEYSGRADPDNCRADR
jgi:hemerythrin-like domain-containing protein